MHLQAGRTTMKKEHRLILYEARRVPPEIIKAFPKAEPRRTKERKDGKGRIVTDTPEMTEIESQIAKNGKKKYSGEIHEQKTVKMMLKRSVKRFYVQI
jgi:hypothetical protein